MDQRRGTDPIPQKVIEREAEQAHPKGAEDQFADQNRKSCLGQLDAFLPQAPQQKRGVDPDGKAAGQRDSDRPHGANQKNRSGNIRADGDQSDADGRFCIVSSEESRCKDFNQQKSRNAQSIGCKDLGCGFRILCGKGAMLEKRLNNGRCEKRQAQRGGQPQRETKDDCAAVETTRLILLSGFDMPRQQGQEGCRDRYADDPQRS